MTLTDQIKEITEPIAKSAGCIVYDVTFAREGHDYYLRIFVDKENGKVDLDTIVKISEQLSLELDKLDLIEENYVLDITSLGAERPINVDKLIDFVGDYIHIHLSHPYLGLNDLEGDLEEVNDSTLVLSYKEKTRNKKAVINLSDIDKARLAIKF